MSLAQVPQACFSSRQLNTLLALLGKHLITLCTQHPLSHRRWALARLLKEAKQPHNYFPSKLWLMHEDEHKDRKSPFGKKKPWIGLNGFLDFQSIFNAAMKQEPGNWFQLVNHLSDNSFQETQEKGDPPLQVTSAKYHMFACRTFKFCKVLLSMRAAANSHYLVYPK